jgi:EAL domain-containing protein (putative c-di-GMP-specific phosphodiesterase class I)
MEDDDFVIALHNAILNNEFVLYYQPCICLTTDKIVGFEALIRWVRPGRGIVPPAELKIDRIFISGLPDNPEDASITHAIIDLAHHLGISVVAEGVEREEQSVFLRNHKCDYAQGYWYNRPLPPDEIIELLHAKRWLTNAFINRGRAGSNLRTIASGAI